MPLQCYSWQCHSNLYIFNNNNNKFGFVGYSSELTFEFLTVLFSFLKMFSHVYVSPSKQRELVVDMLKARSLGDK